ncbi:MAG TPA: anthranilate synthase component I [Bacillales bacterium]|nr:anthranilate synthase component I [Bacillales bacterium]
MNENRSPLARKRPFSKERWFQKYRNLSRTLPYHTLLESVGGGRYSVIGLQPEAVIEAKGQRFEVEAKGNRIIEYGKPLELMREWMEGYKSAYVEEYPDFQGGAIGFMAYDLIRGIECLPMRADDDLMMPDLCLLVFNDVYVFDQKDNVIWFITNYESGEKVEAENRLDRMEEVLDFEDSADVNPCKEPFSDSPFESSMTRKQFMEAVEKAKRYIAQGDVFQVNLSLRQSQPLNTAPLHIYEKLRQLNPSPYMGYLHCRDFQIVSGSPELLVRKKGRNVETRPIAGTRSRGRTEKEDLRLEQTLLANQKERAEHAMLVDLERNDLGRVSEYGSVVVNELMTVEKYSHVMHIVSNVRGRLANGLDAYDVIPAVFPGGTITGAPKVRTMEIIEELEPTRRGVYTGSIGWIGFSGDMELNIAIRTMVVRNGRAYVQAGAGIVADSDPQAEYKEALKKSRALWRAKELSEEGSKEKVEMS